MRKLKLVQFKNPIEVTGNKSFYHVKDGFEIVLEDPYIHIKYKDKVRSSSVFNAVQYEFDTYAQVFVDANDKKKKTLRKK